MVPGAFLIIIDGAFNGTAAAGGFAGATIAAAMQWGIARGVFSNESGLGSAAIAHAAAKTNNPVRQGTVAMLGTFIDTILICTMTALVIITVQVPVMVGEGANAITETMGSWTSGKQGVPLTQLAFGTGLPNGEWIVTFGMIVFAFTTIIAWSYYGERATEFLFGVKAIMPYRILWVVIVALGASVKFSMAWLIADILNGLMALPNLIGLLLLSGTVVALTRSALSKDKDD